MPKPPSQKRVIVGVDKARAPRHIPRPRIVCTPAQRLAAMLLLRQAGHPDAFIGAVFGISRQEAHALMGPVPEPREGEAGPSAGDRLAAELRAFRGRRRWTQEKLARLLGTSQPILSQWETGRTGCALPGVVRLCLQLLDKVDDISLTENNY